MKTFLFLLISTALAAQGSGPPASSAAPPSLNQPTSAQMQKCGTGLWTTPAEASCYRTTPRYDETMAYVQRVAAAAPPQVKVETFGKTGEGRDLVAVIVSKDGIFDPAALHAHNLPIVLIQNSIHAGEMDGKDSCLALLRDMVITKTRARLLDRSVLLVIPIYNADGHERFGPYNRINQNGPQEMGWRTQANNLNLNRDYLKADAPETRAFLRLWNRWLPDFFVDDHVTDGADFQYDTTYALDTGPNVFPAIAQWQRNMLAPYLEESVTAAGHVIGPIGNAVLIQPENPAKGLIVFADSPRYSTGYAVLQNRPGMLVEMHMLKDYKTRVTGNYEILRALLEVINRDADALLKMNRDADTATIAEGKIYNPEARFPLVLTPAETSHPFLYRGYKANISKSDISGGTRAEYTREPLNITVPKFDTLRVARAIAPPAAYIIPAQWTSLIDVLQAHGLKLLHTSSPWTTTVQTYRCDPPTWQTRSFEGHHVLSGAGEFSAKPAALSCKIVEAQLAFPRGSVIVPLDQRAAKVAIHFLEPEAPDSAVAWGFLNAIFEQKEYGENYVLEKLAREMLQKDPKLKEDFDKRLATDKEFAASPEARLNFFYQHSPWWDSHLGLYPVGRLTSLQGAPIE